MESPRGDCHCHFDCHVLDVDCLASAVYSLINAIELTCSSLHDRLIKGSDKIIEDGIYVVESRQNLYDVRTRALISLRQNFAEKDQERL